VNQRLPPTRSVSLEKSAKRRRKEVYESFRIAIAIFNLVRYRYANRPNPLTPFPLREGGKIQSLSPFRREVEIVPYWVEKRYIAGYGVNVISEKFIINNQQPTIY
jgi:hypothetical protein